ncbi:MAG TPA: sulfatase [Thermoanaerobaculia bacterium]
MSATRALATGRAALAAAAVALASPSAAPGGDRPRFPDVLLVTVDTLRADRLSSAGYARPTSPHLDALLASGLRFSRALTVEPLTNPALASLLTSLPPHEHGATRNGLPARRGLASLPALLARRGYRTAAFVGNWTLKPLLSGLAELWQTYSAVVSRKRWFGFYKDEATARDLTDEALAWLDRMRRDDPVRPYFLWLHYVEPHAPYRLHERHAARLGIDPDHASASDRYDTEVAEVDAEVGRLLAELDARPSARHRLTIFTADHGEAFGEDGELGHGRRLHAPTLVVPLVFVAPGRIAPGGSPAPASLLDVAPTVLGLLGLPAHPYFRGHDLAPGQRGEQPIAEDSTCLQAHRGAVQSVQRAQRARRAGLLEVGLLVDGWLETLEVASGRHRHLPLGPPGAVASARPASLGPSPALAACLAEVRAGLAEADRYVPPELDAESIEQLRALGYLD